MFKDKKLEELLTKAANTLTNARNARHEVMDYLEENYNFSEYHDFDEIEESFEWCFGINWNAVRRITEGDNNNEMR